MTEADDFSLIRALVGDLREDLAQHRTDIASLRQDLAADRGEVSTKLAKIEGALELLAAVKSAEDHRLEELIRDVRHRGRNTEEALKATMNRIEEFPRPTDVAEAIALGKNTRDRVDRAVWTVVGASVGAGLGGAGGMFALVRALGLG